MELEDEADVLVAKRGELGIGQRGEVGIRHPHRAGVDRVEPAENVEERALPHARRADDCHHLPLLHLQIQAAQHGQHGPADRIALGQPADLDECHARLLVPQRLRGIEPRGLA